MIADPRGPVRIAVIRAWYEAGSRPGLRVRITGIEGLGGEPTTTVVASTDELCILLSEWLTQIGPADAGREPPRTA